VSPASAPSARDLLSVQVRHRLRSFELDVNLRVGRETLALVGPSGAGKTSVLRAIAGLLAPEWARITFAGRALLDTERGVDLPPESRRVGMMFQDGALFPHLSIAGNVEYGLRPRPRRRERRARVDELLARYGIADLRDARPGRVSGGERQRAALARAVATGPEILLLDEPLSALDSVTKARVSRELAQWLTELGLPTILVSHDYVDVAGLADRIAVIDEGRIVQTGTAADLQRAPASPFVGAFVATNYVRGTARREGDLTVVTLPGGVRVVCATPATGDVALVIDPWAVRLARADAAAAEPAAPNRVAGPVVQMTRLGGVARVTVDAGPQLMAELPCDEADRLGLERTCIVTATWSPEAVRVVEPRPAS
jgi:molybdate transport system ATP-binding protein